MSTFIYFEVVLRSELKKRELHAETKKTERKVLDGNDNKVVM